MRLIDELIDYCNNRGLLTDSQLNQLESLGLYTPPEDNYDYDRDYYEDPEEKLEKEIELRELRSLPSRGKKSKKIRKTITAPQLDDLVEKGLESLWLEPAVMRTLEKITVETGRSFEKISEDEMRPALIAALDRTEKGHLTLNDIYAAYVAFPDLSFLKDDYLKDYEGPSVQSLRQMLRDESYSLVSNKYGWILKHPNIKKLCQFHIFKHRLMNAVASIRQTDKELFKRWSSDCGRLYVHDWERADWLDTTSLKVWTILRKKPQTMTLAEFEEWYSIREKWLSNPVVSASVLRFDPDSLTDCSHIAITGFQSVPQSMTMVEFGRLHAKRAKLQPILVASACTLRFELTSLTDYSHIAITNANIKAGERSVLPINGIDFALRWCPPGTFMMGSPVSEEERVSNEKQHKVTLTKGFWMLETPVTQIMWWRVMKNNPSGFQGYGYNDFPVEQVSWDDCQEFIKKLNAMPPFIPGFKFSLPSEAQWEYACRAGTITPFSFGGILNGDKANCNGNYPYGTTNKGPYLSQTTKVRSYEPNAWGLYDMHGNVWEWCNDRYGGYPSGRVTDPTGKKSGSLRVIRGGGWRSSA